MIATPTDIQNILNLSDDEMAELRKQQEKALKKFRSKAILTEKEKREGRAAELLQHHFKTRNFNGIAEAYAMTGKFQLAADMAENPKLKAVLQEKADAIESDDADCDCPTFYEEGGLNLPNQHVESNVYSLKHGRLMPAIRCRACKTLNVRAILPHLADQQAARRQSLANESRQVTAAEFFK